MMLFGLILAFLGFQAAAIIDPSAHFIAKEQVISGQVKVLDGDTLSMGSQRIRLHGIDAPEKAQTCSDSNGDTWRPGRAATRWLTRTLASQTVTCTTVDRDRYKRLVSRCLVNGQDIGDMIVSRGWAMAYRKYSSRYVSAERKARAQGRGIWRGRCQSPWSWRASRS